MVKINHHFYKLSGDYLFPEIERRVLAYQGKLNCVNSSKNLLNLGVGDATAPVPSVAIRALCSATEEMGNAETMRGYSPPEGYNFLREAIARHDYKDLKIDPSEIFISDGAQSDIGNFQELFSRNNKIALQDPTYPVYLDSNVMAGRTRPLLKTGRYGGVVYLSCTEENGFQPRVPAVKADIIYLCFPNNPTGITMDKTSLKQWVNYAKENKAVILVDGAYSAFVSSVDAPRSIYEIKGAKEVAVEFRSFSKPASFTGLRCSYSVVPKELQLFEGSRAYSAHHLWLRRHSTKFNGVAYPIQKAAEALFTPEGQEETQRIVNSYLERAKIFAEGLKKIGYTVYGGEDAPYLWCKTPHQMTSWAFFEYLLTEHQIIAIPGRGFGCSGEGFIRFSGFAKKPVLNEALDRLEQRK